MGKKSFYNSLIASSSSVVDENWLFFIKGQSNAKGWNTGAPSEAHLLDVIPRVFIWAGSWQPLEYGVTNQGFSGHGIELNLGYLASQLTTGNIYIVKESEGATTLYDDPGTTLDWSPTGTLFPLFVSKANSAISNLNTNTIPFIYKGDWWSQGEADALDEDFANAYAVNLDGLETRVRSEITGVPESMPFIVGLLSNQTTAYPYKAIVRTAQMTKTYIDNDDLDLQGDVKHYTSESQNIIAQRFLDLVK